MNNPYSPYPPSYIGAQPPAAPAGYQMVLVQTPYGPAYQPVPVNNPQPPASSGFSLTNDRFIKGLMIGAAATYLATNENVQKTAIKSAVKMWTLVQGGMEEMKERFHDAEAELRASESSED